MKKTTILIALFLSLFIIKVQAQEDKFLKILEDELNREFEELKKQETAPYYINYRVDEEYSSRISASFGTLESESKGHDRVLTVNVRVGSKKLDNYHELRDDISSYFGSYSPLIKLPIEDNEYGVKQIVWKATDQAYKEAITNLAKVKANIAVKVAELDTAEDFSTEKVYSYYEENYLLNEQYVNPEIWKPRLKKYSEYFKADPDIFHGSASIRYSAQRKYFLSTEGTQIVQNQPYARLMISGTVKSSDGMELPLNLSYFSFSPDQLPSDEIIIEDVKLLVKKLTELKNAPIVEPYTGPAIMSGAASGVFFHEIFGHRVEGQRQKSESDGQTFKKKIGEKVLPETMSVIFDPTLSQFEGNDLNGFYKYDDQGIKGEKVDVVENGILKGFLMSRVPIEGFSNSNGHGRAYKGKQPVTRQSNLLVTTTRHYTDEELRKILIKEAKKQGKEYGYFFKNVTGGFTMTGRFIPNSFNVMPTEVYRIYIDGRPDELVRGVDLVGTPLSMFSKIEAAGGDFEIFTGMCGAESGWIPVTSISPALFVSQIEMQKKYKSQDRPIILSRPDLESNFN